MEKTNKKIFIKLGENIVPKPEGVDYELINGKVYELTQERGSGVHLKESKDFDFPKNYTLSDEDLRFIKKSIDAFNRTTKMTTGVMLSGIKGSGKTLMAKYIAKQTKLPIIVIDPVLCVSDIEDFFSKTDTPCCIIFDEIDKRWNTRHMLSFLDGVKPTCKKLVICTCNKEDDIDEYLNDRCSRIRYKKRFTSLDKTAAFAVINEAINNKAKAEAATEYLFAKANLISYDNTAIFAEEIRNNPNESFDSIFKDLNISTTDENKQNTTQSKLKNMIDSFNDDCCATCCAG
jgi:SpoVK/Ycf46/Vps4 family AAA+-type ATPase